MTHSGCEHAKVCTPRCLDMTSSIPQVQPQHHPAALIRAVQFITNSLLKARPMEHPYAPELFKPI